MIYTDKDKALRYAEAEYKAQLDEGDDQGVVVIQTRNEFSVEAGDGGFVRSWECVIWRNGKTVK